MVTVFSVLVKVTVDRVPPMTESEVLPLFAVLFTAIRAFSKKKLTHKGLPLQSEDYKDLIRIEEDGTPVYRTAPAAEEPQAKAKDGE